MIRYLIDTNVLLYPMDARDPWKQSRAEQLLLHLARTESAALSIQALSEFASVALRKLIPPLSPKEASQQLERLIEAFPVFPLTPAVVLEALRGVERHGLSFYDAQVWAVARLQGIPLILSEDFPSGAVLEGVGFLNPFDPALEVARL